MNKRIKVWGLSNQDSGVQFYRINQPLRFIGHQKLANIHTMPFFGQHARHLTSLEEFGEYYAKEGKWADILYSTLASDRQYLALLLGLRDQFGLKLVIDLDDDILSTHLEPNNPAYKAYLQQGARFAEYAQACLREADMVIVSTEYLKRKYESINPNIHVVSNCIDPGFFSHENKLSEDIVIGYAGSGSHQKDWEMVEPVLKDLKDTYGVKVKVLGPMHTKIADEQVSWVDMLKYPAELAALGFTIGIAPLRDSMMSRAKSNLRWLEYSALKIPTVASDVVPFRGVDNIVLVENEEEAWYAALEELILQEKKRTELGKKAYDEMRKSYDPSEWSRELYTNFRELHAGGQSGASGVSTQGG
jgi:glycosyltransferase involved in cell wall biosynthesis